MERASTEDLFPAYGAHNLNISQATNPVYLLDILNNGPYGVFIHQIESNRLLKQFNASM
jgi:hypothetical protein